MSIPLFYLVGGLAGLAMALLCLKADVICARFGLLDLPDERKLHPLATPLMGGIALLAVALPMTAIFAAFSNDTVTAPHVFVWVGAVAVMALLGLADDRHTLSAKNRLLVSFFVFGITAFVDPHFNVRLLNFKIGHFDLGLGDDWSAYIFTGVCCVGLANAVNMADGKNGLVLGLCTGWLLLLATRTNGLLQGVTLILAICCIVLLLFNLNGKLFLGDGGAYGLATAIGLIAIACYNTPGFHAGRQISADEMVLLFLVPVIDSFRLTYARLSRGQSPMAADRDHLHHHLQNRFGWPGGLIVYLVIALLPASLVFLLT